MLFENDEKPDNKHIGLEIGSIVGGIYGGSIIHKAIMKFSKEYNLIFKSGKAVGISKSGFITDKVISTIIVASIPIIIGLGIGAAVDYIREKMHEKNAPTKQQEAVVTAFRRTAKKLNLHKK